MAEQRIPWGTQRPFQCEDDGYWRVFTCEPCWPANGEDMWLFNGGPAFASEASAQRYATIHQTEEAHRALGL